jgi:aspartyl protease family protein
MFVWLALVLAVLGGFAMLQFGSAHGLDIGQEQLLSGGAGALLIIVALVTSKSRAHGESILHRLALPAGIGALALGALTWGVYNHAPVRNFLAQTVTVAPESATEAAEGPKAVRIRRNPNGQFVARGGINQSAAEFLVDTGAAVVLLRQTDAEKAGIDMSALTFSVPVETANGTTYAAPVRLRSLSIGPLQIAGLEALVAAPGSLNESLLGISFLRRLRSYELAGDFMTLRE